MEHGFGGGQSFGCDQALQGCQPVVIVVRAVIRRGCFNLRGKGGGPFLPGEVALLGELDGEREGLRFPRFGENFIRLVQGSHPTYRYRRNRAVRLGGPTTRARRSVPNKRAAVFRREKTRWCSGTR